MTSIRSAISALPRARRALFTVALALVATAALIAQTNQPQVPVWPREPEAPNAPKPTAAVKALAEVVGEYESAATPTQPAHRMIAFEQNKQMFITVDRGEPKRASNILINRDKASGAIKGITIGTAAYARVQVGPENGSQLQVAPVKPVAEVLKAAQAMTPPKETGTFKPSELVELTTLDPSITLEGRYATTNNFLGSIFYAEARAFLQRPAAEAVVRAAAVLKPLGYGILVHDGYRPWYVTRAFWDATPEDKHWLVAVPEEGSKHNRGCAVDLTLYDLATGEAIDMPSTYDESTPRAYAFYPGGTSLQRWHRALLRRTMEAQGFSVNPKEWWHFDYKDWKSYGIGNVAFDQIH